MSPARTENKNNAHIGGRIFYCVILLVGVMLCVWELYIYRLTVINKAIPIAIILVVGVTVFFFNSNHYKKLFNVRGIFFPLFQNIISWGFISCYIFMAVNYYGAGTEVRTLEFDIKSKSSMPGSKGRRDERSPFVTINYFGVKKELIFGYADTKRVNAATRVTVTVKRGLLGFDVLDHFDVVDR